MAAVDVIRAWKDADYRESLTAEELASLPANPAGMVELSDNELLGVTGGLMIEPMTQTRGCDYSYETRPSCGYYCTLTMECNCSSVQSVSVE
jgi:mersacidin/lichenicidin family type 2 lantibiotic